MIDTEREAAAAQADGVRRSVARATVIAVRDGAAARRPDRLAVEEPMEIRLGAPGREPESLAVTMRTPGHDFELAAGFLLTEGIVRSREDVTSVRYCDLPDEEQRYNVVTVRAARPLDAPVVARAFSTTSSCGVCGKASLEQVEVRCDPVAEGPVVDAAVIASLPGRLREGQRLFEETGGLHAAALFDSNGALVALREDVGRHNAVDKLVGRALLAGELPLSGQVLQVSGRVSFEIVQKAAVAGIPIVAAVSAPSSLAVDAAETLGVTVIGFVRKGGFNVYTHPERVALRG